MKSVLVSVFVLRRFVRERGIGSGSVNLFEGVLSDETVVHL